MKLLVFNHFFLRNKNDNFIWFSIRELDDFYSPFPSIYTKGHFDLIVIHGLCKFGEKAKHTYLMLPLC